MKKIHFTEIPNIDSCTNYCLDFDGDKTDKRLHLSSHINWWEDNENEYNKIEKEISEKEIIGKGYTVYAWCDVSGFDYWINQMEEGNYIQITVSIDNDGYFTREEVDKMLLDVDDLYNHFEQYESYKPFD